MILVGKPFHFYIDLDLCFMASVLVGLGDTSNCDF